MKMVVIAALIAATILPAKGQIFGQIFSRDSLGGAVIGGLAGGIIGHNSGGRTAEGIGIGVGAGLLLGAISSSSRRYYYEGPYAADYYGYPTGSTYRTRPNYAATGTILGGVAGGVIGHNSGRHTAEGIAIGAGTGLLIGGLAEHEQRKRERAEGIYAGRYRPGPPVVISRPGTVVTIVPAPQAVEQTAEPVETEVPPVQPPGAKSSMSSVNALFGR